MKKFMVLFVAMMLSIPSFASANTDAKKDESAQLPTEKQVEKMNKALDKMGEKANEKLEKGEENFVLKEKYAKGKKEVVEFGFESQNTTSSVNTQEMTALIAYA
ncbi:hypothetical protein SAMN05192559_101828 [Halobacillus karajensis]|uniref:Uncharacterized protein n=1 Tax=Halobacillus karajensis TaxID=195088 RepID=A0A059NXB2_9BACI|nr:hypothetical protein [Halobacillus karajensis]CDQ18560.1 hypothetical protein BN982_00834 [Halobacillus karajensis]CDQ23368.1 hypothetical protein BN983_01594 [Halobacillus karajensis]CDQ26850.1 hypothetical protein BN981_01074 [Halobacillus karajensis]SEH49906.1 hypothetical protein SAMN05192559_101828 [Halobacillus karajensis]